jgi:hypothetical protein
MGVLTPSNEYQSVAKIFLKWQHFQGFPEKCHQGEVMGHQSLLKS